MNSSMSIEDRDDFLGDCPGGYLGKIREQQGLSLEYVAGKLHLRVRMIELLEEDDYQNMPEPVFIKGYLRAYAKLLDVASEPLLETFNRLYTTEKKLEKALWQTRREFNRAEYALRWFTALFATVVLIAVFLWWQRNKENEKLFPKTLASNDLAQVQPLDNDVRLTDLSKMRSLLSSTHLNSDLGEDKQDG